MQILSDGRVLTRPTYYVQLFLTKFIFAIKIPGTH